MSGNVYLIPNTLGDTSIGEVIPVGVIQILHSIKHFIVEDIRNARRFLIKTAYPHKIDDIVFFELNKHTILADIPEFLIPCLEGHNTGIISEAGVPSVADPGALVVEIAHKRGIRVIPLTGPSSILLALMASGLNGQNFAFIGYLPKERTALIKAIKDMEMRSAKEKQTQIFIETPFRNNKLFEEILKVCKPTTQLCIARNITTSEENILVMSIKEWASNRSELDKQPLVFLIQA